jgi:hypothetical protein
MLPDGQVHAAAASVLEVAIPFGVLAAAVGGTKLAFLVTVEDSEGNEIERLPGLRPIDILVPDRWFDARNWTA